MKPFLLTGLLLLPLMLTGCQALAGISAEQAALQSILENNQPESQVDQQTIRLLQSQPWGEGKLVLLAYQRMEQSGARLQCLHLSEVIRPRGRWMASGSGGGCGPVSGQQDPLDVMAGSNRIGDRPGVSDVTGMVNDAAIVAVEVVWEDGEVQRVDVINSSYLAAREGRHEPAEVRGLDADGNVTYTFQQPQAAPGKNPQ